MLCRVITVTKQTEKGGLYAAIMQSLGLSLGSPSGIPKRKRFSLYTVLILTSVAKGTLCLVVMACLRKHKCGKRKGEGFAPYVDVDFPSYLQVSDIYDSRRENK